MNDKNLKSIIIVTDRPEGNRRLLELAGALFPRCEIRLAAVDVEVANVSKDTLPSKPSEHA